MPSCVISLNCAQISMKTKFEFPVIELVDRYTIARVKFDKTNGANAPELEFYQQQIDQLDTALIQEDLDKLETIHRQIWAMEDDFKKRRIDGADLSEIGRRALDIRDLNNYRVQYKNNMAAKLNSAVREIKQDHVSEN
jgi:flagellar biosynthesis chaperone FliJ